MDCLIDYIGLQGCGSTAPDSGLYLNDLAGIELKQIDEIANDDQQNYLGVWDKVQRRAINKFASELRNAFRKKYQLKGVTQSINIGKLIDSTVTKAASAEYRGATIELNDANCEFVDSNHQVIFIQKVNIYVPGAETFNFKIFDLDTDTELYTESITTTAAGWTSININDYYLGSRRIRVVYDCSSIDSVKLNLEDHNLNCFKECQAKVTGGSSTIADPYTVTEDTYNTQGLSLIYSIQCKYDVVICNNKDRFAQALLYCLGSEMMLEQSTSSRTTRWTLLDNKQAKYLHKYYKAVYMGGIFDEDEFKGELEDAVNLINLDQYDCCVDCAGDITFQNSYI